MTGLPLWLRSRTAAFVHDVAMIPVAWMGAWWVRFNLEPIPETAFNFAIELLPILLLAQSPVFVYFGLYRGVWRFASLPDLARILKAVVIGAGLSAVMALGLMSLEGVPRVIFPLYGLLLILCLGAPRLLYRWLKDGRLEGSSGKRVLIVGAGTAGEMLARDLLRARERDYVPVAFVDDSPAKRAADIHGIRVVGDCRAIPRIVSDLDVEMILIAAPSANVAQMRGIVEICERTGCEFRTLPRVRDLAPGRITHDALREVSIEDLLGRDPVNLDWESMRGNISGKMVVVTGGGGSIGSELCEQIARLGPGGLIVYEINEFALYRVEQHLREAFPKLNLHPVLADVLDNGAIDWVFKRFAPDIVFHAAAYKHVPMLQRQLREAVRNNVLGTRVVAEAVERYDVPALVLISTDKAVDAVNVLGATKRVAELICDSYNGRSRSRFMTVRFGNVLGSAGSVVPLFREQIRRGGPVTVTHPDVSRYFMTVSEACQLILRAAMMGEGGEIFVLDMGEPVNIHRLAEEMIRLTGKAPGEEIDIVHTGLRPGEKLSEELFHSEEELVPTPHEKIRLALHQKADRSALTSLMDMVEAACDANDQEKLNRLLWEIVRGTSGEGEGMALEVTGKVVSFPKPKG